MSMVLFKVIPAAALAPHVALVVGAMQWLMARLASLADDVLSSSPDDRGGKG
jgi:hypothetical protein